jgi:nucleotide-binding universal stress UspA family protein
MGIKKILFSTKFRDLALDSLNVFIGLKKVGLEEIVLLYVIEIEEVGFVPYGGYLKEEEERLRQIANIHFRQWQQNLKQMDINSKVYIEVGKSTGKIISVAEKEKVDFIVAGRKKRKGFERIYMGSTMLNLARLTKVPLLVFKYMADVQREGETVTRVNDKPFERPLLATDWSPPDNRALGYIINFSNIIKEINVIHVLTGNFYKQELQKQNKEKLEAISANLDQSGIKARCSLYAGESISEEILNASRELNATMIVMGTTAKNKLRGILLGSVSHRVAELSELPVLLIS